LAEPDLELPMASAPILGRLFPALRDSSSAPTKVLGQRGKPNLRSTAVHIGRLLEGKWTKVARFIPVKLGTIDLPAALEAPNSVLEHGYLDRVDLAARSLPQKP
jgi:hypothetical protein